MKNENPTKFPPFKLINEHKNNNKIHIERETEREDNGSF